MIKQIRKLAATILGISVIALTATTSWALTVDELVGVWDMNYDMGQGNQTGTITITRNDDGSAAIRLNTQGGGASDASNIMIEGEELKFSRQINAQGQSLGVDYSARLVDGNLEGSFELDVPGLGTIPWTATRQ